MRSTDRDESSMGIASMHDRGTGHRFFFFQAEDGIRDLTVTGVQTCALPISKKALPCRTTGVLQGTAVALLPLNVLVGLNANQPSVLEIDRTGVAAELKKLSDEIGRASCRERV